MSRREASKIIRGELLLLLLLIGVLFLLVLIAANAGEVAIVVNEAGSGAREYVVEI